MNAAIIAYVNVYWNAIGVVFENGTRLYGKEWCSVSYIMRKRNTEVAQHINIANVILEFIEQYNKYPTVILVRTPTASEVYGIPVSAVDYFQEEDIWVGEV